MSLLWAWEQMLAEPDRVEAEQRELGAARDPRDEDEGPERYCPHCLADTMTAIKA